MEVFQVGLHFLSSLSSQLEDEPSAAHGQVPSVDHEGPPDPLPARPCQISSPVSAGDQRVEDVSEDDCLPECRVCTEPVARHGSVGLNVPDAVLDVPGIAAEVVQDRRHLLRDDWLRSPSVCPSVARRRSVGDHRPEGVGRFAVSSP